MMSDIGGKAELFRSLRALPILTPIRERRTSGTWQRALNSGPLSAQERTLLAKARRREKAGIEFIRKNSIRMCPYVDDSLTITGVR